MKKILLSLSMVLVVGVVVAGATGAFFADTAVSGSNTFSSGTMNLRLTDSNETNQDSVSASFGGTALAPGAVIPQQTILLANAGSVNGDHIDLTVAIDPPGTGTDLAKNLVFTGTDGLRLGTGPGAGANILSVLSGGAQDSDYAVTNGLTGALLGDIRGLDGVAGLSVKDLQLAGKIRIQKAGMNGGINAGTSATLFSNIVVANTLTTQGETLTATFTFALEQDATQF